MGDCIFCKIVKGELPSTKYYEDDQVLAFQDINAMTPVHVLVIPKQHIESMNDIDESNSAVISRCFEVISKLGRELKLDGGYRVISNCGEDGGQIVPHQHFHLLGGKKLGSKIVG